MSGHRNFKELRDRLVSESPESEGRIAEARSEFELAMSLAELRHARELTQTQLAHALDVQQPAVSRIEHQTDLYVSTLRSYVEALGGELQIVAQFGATAVMLNGFEELEEPDEVDSLKTMPVSTSLP
jgi:transcriptional regulator with XRE-family HTH domain